MNHATIPRKIAESSQQVNPHPNDGIQEENEEEGRLLVGKEGITGVNRKSMYSLRYSVEDKRTNKKLTS
ncbi:hypothetical protein C0J52_24885 [Blattella germanica]|nr:hypothetical protein C0J52_24885 [Blattella germanica]